MDAITRIITENLFANTGFGSIPLNGVLKAVEFTPDFHPMTDEEIDREIDAMLGPIN